MDETIRVLNVYINFSCQYTPTGKQCGVPQYSCPRSLTLLVTIAKLSSAEAKELFNSV